MARLQTTSTGHVIVSGEFTPDLEIDGQYGDQRSTSSRKGTFKPLQRPHALFLLLTPVRWSTARENNTYSFCLTALSCS